MNNKTRIFVVVLCLLVVAGLAYVLLKKDPTPAPVANEMPATEQPKREQKPEISEPAPVQKGEYTEYSANKVAATKGTKLLFFHAPWCPQCRELDASIKSTALPDNLTIFKVDYDTNQPLRAKYGVTIQTTVVKIDDKGNKLASYVAYEKPVFASVEQALLK